jgi:hypothetical protein
MAQAEFEYERVTATWGRPVSHCDPAAPPVGGPLIFFDDPTGTPPGAQSERVKLAMIHLLARRLVKEL